MTRPAAVPVLLSALALVLLTGTASANGGLAPASEAAVVVVGENEWRKPAKTGPVGGGFDAATLELPPGRVAFSTDTYVVKPLFFRQDFAAARSLGIRGFPAVLLSRNGDLALIASGFTRATRMQETLERILAAP